MPSVYIETYGCQMNLADTELMRGQLARSGYTTAADPALADVILLNTCAIREHAEERIFGRLGTLARHKLDRPHVQIGLAGCLPAAAGHARRRPLRRCAAGRCRDLRRPGPRARCRRARLDHHHARLR